ncbi:MAG TPA: CAP domain-containing protein [Solirubrobacteraceae bacterium]|nr:CAP domain-containing protein [Solirubrobacteraceae bacterium]
MNRSALRRVLAPLALALLLSSVPATASAAAAPCANADLVPTAANVAQVRSATLCLINRERTSRGLRRLRHDGQLRKVAESYSAQMVTHGFFAHVGHDGSTLKSRIVGATKYLKQAASWSLGENLYWGSGQRATPQGSVQGWMNSPGHRRNMLDRRFKDIGIGIALGAPQDVGGTPAATYTTEFGTRTR